MAGEVADLLKSSTILSAVNATEVYDQLVRIFGRDSALAALVRAEGGRRQQMHLPSFGQPRGPQHLTVDRDHHPPVRAASA